MQLSIPCSSSVSLFVIEMMAIIHSLKCTVPFSFAVPLLSLVVSNFHSLSHFRTHFHSLSLVVQLAVIRCNSLPFVFTRCTTRCHPLSLALPLVVICCHSLSLDVPLVCLFINDHLNGSCILHLMSKNHAFQLNC